jgi:tRNA 5-methylaminomethyl-2-thiouridine biosynthesis bifunctional protein
MDPTPANQPKPANTGSHGTLALTPATVQWHPEGPKSSHFEDRYFHPEDGAGESRYVFLSHNQLPERFANLDDQTFIIVETGFGTGLNCLETIALFKQTAPANARLQIISCDKHPLSRTDLTQASQQATTQWPHLQAGYAELIEQYPPLIRGTHCIRWSDPRIQLLLWWDDIQVMLENLDRPIDAWFLDGFAPSRNPAMWAETVFEQMKRLAKPGKTTFATFTAASAVRRTLESTGFEVVRTKGYGHKRHMLHGVARTDFITCQNTCGSQKKARSTSPASFVQPPWFSTETLREHKSAKSVAVIGAGIAGLTTAYLLSEQGLKVSLFDSAPAPVQGGSGNPQAVLYTRLSAVNQAANRFHNNAFQCAINHLERLGRNPAFTGFTRSGCLEKLDEASLKQWQNILTTCFHDTDWVSIQKDTPPLAPQSPCLSFPRAGWFAPAELAQALLGLSKVQTYFGHEIIACEPDAENGGWMVKRQTSETCKNEKDNSADQHHSVDAIILCAPQSIKNLLPGFYSQLRPLPGQVNRLRANTATESLQTVLTGPCTFLPAHDGFHTIGSTYRPGSTDDHIRVTDSKQNIQQLRTLSSALREQFAEQPPEASPARAATRWNTRDYLPLVGPVPDLNFYENAYGRNREQIQLQKRTWSRLPPAQYHTNLWINTGHGSRGFTQSWLTAEIIFADLTGAQSPIDQAIRAALHPARYFMRDLMRHGGPSQTPTRHRHKQTSE